MKLFELKKWYNLNSILNQDLIKQNQNQDQEIKLQTLDTIIFELSLIKVNRLFRKNKKGQEITLYFPSQNPYFEEYEIPVFLQEGNEQDIINAYISESNLIQKTINKRAKDDFDMKTTHFAYLDLAFELLNYDINPNLVNNYILMLNGLNKTFISDIPHYDKDSQEHITFSWAPLTKDIYECLTEEYNDSENLIHFGDLLLPYNKQSLNQIYFSVHNIEDFKKS